MQSLKDNLRSHTPAVILTGIGVIAAISIFIAVSRQSEVREYGPLLAQFIESASHTVPYRADVEVSIPQSGKMLSIEGLYFVNHETREYYSFSTTSVTDIDNTTPSISFTIENIALNNWVYLRITPLDAYSRKTVRGTDSWVDFPANEIPVKYTDIAVSGPVQDNLALFSENGSLIELLKSERSGGADSPTETYTFKLSSKGMTAPSGPVRAIADHIGSLGYIYVTIPGPDNSDARMIFSGNNYSATTTIRTKVSLPTFVPEK